MSYYEQNLESRKPKNEKIIIGLKHKSKISNEIEKLKKEITTALKKNVVFFNSPKNEIDIKSNLNDEKTNDFSINKEFNIKNNNRPFEKFNFN